MLDAVQPIDVDDGERPVLPYGSWPSPISVAVAVAGSRGLAEVRPDGRDVLFLESRPDQGGRVALVRLRPDGTTEEAVPQDLNVRTRVHQYGGGAYAVRDGVIVLSEFAGNRLIVTGAGEAAPRTLVDDPALRFADMELDPARDRVLAVMEDQRASEQDPRNLVVAVSLLDGSLTELVAGHDFYSDPRLDRTGSRIAFLTWDRPNMPWDGSDLWVVDVQPDGRVGLPHHVAGGPDESIVQPTWSPDGSLVFVSDRTGWWNLYRWRSGASDPVALAPADAEFAGPQWVFGLHWFDIAPDGTIVAVASEEGVDTLHVLAPGEAAREVPLDATSISSLRVAGDSVLCVLGSATRPSAVARIDVSSGRVERLHEANRLPVEEAWLSRPRHITFPSADGRSAHAWFYPPTNPRVTEPEDELPAARRHVARRPDLRGPDDPQPRAPGLHEPWLRGRGRGLWRQHRLRARLPRAPRRQLGHRRCRGLRERRALARGRKASSTATGSPSVAGARAATRRSRRCASVPKSSPPGRRISASATSRPSRSTRTSSSRATRTGSSRPSPSRPRSSEPGRR